MEYKRAECETNEHSQRVGIVQHTVSMLFCLLLCFAFA